MYADFDTYVKRYGDDLSPFRDEVTAARYLRAASREIDRFTFDRFGGTLPESTTDAESCRTARANWPNAFTALTRRVTARLKPQTSAA